MVHGVIKPGGEAKSRAQTHGRQHIAYLRNAVVGEKALEVMLGKRHRHAHEHAHTAHEHQKELERAEPHGLEQEVGQADDAVNAGLRQHAGDEHGYGRGGRAVRVGGEGMEGHDEGLCGEAYVQEREGQLRGVIDVAGNERGELGEVERVKLRVEHDDAHEHAGRAHAAHDHILERGLKRAVRLVAEGRQRDGGEGEDLHHDEHVEDIAREHKTHNAAREHEEERVVLRHIVVMIHVLKRVHARDEHRRGDKKPEEQAERIDLKRDTDGVAARNGARAHPVGDYLALKENGLYERDHARERRGDGEEGDGVSERLALAEHDDEERAEEKHHYGVDREVVIVKKAHPLSLLISRVSMVP